jgi:hypothetical protein
MGGVEAITSRQVEHNNGSHVPAKSHCRQAEVSMEEVSSPTRLSIDDSVEVESEYSCCGGSIDDYKEERLAAMICPWLSSVSRALGTQVSVYVSDTSSHSQFKHQNTTCNLCSMYQF